MLWVQRPHSYLSPAQALHHLLASSGAGLILGRSACVVGHPDVTSFLPLACPGVKARPAGSQADAFGFMLIESFPSQGNFFSSGQSQLKSSPQLSKDRAKVSVYDLRVLAGKS